jgi:hypothetical protein
MPTFPVKGKPVPNFLEELFEPTPVVQVEKRAERMARSEKARGRRAEVKVLNDKRALKDRGK